MPVTFCSVVLGQPEIASLVFEFQCGLYDDVRSAFRAYEELIEFDATRDRFECDVSFAKAFAPHAAWEGGLTILPADYFTKHGANDARLPLHMAIAQDLVQLTKRMLRCRPDLVSEDAIVVAFYSNRLEMVELLLDERTNVPELRRNAENSENDVRVQGNMCRILSDMLSRDDASGVELLWRFGLRRGDFARRVVVFSNRLPTSENFTRALAYFPWLLDLHPRLLDAVVAAGGLLPLVRLLHERGVVCLPVLWYQLAWVAPDTTTAAIIDKMILQFINGEPPVIGAGAQGHRLLHQSIVFAPKHQAGLGLKPALVTWSARHRGHSLRYMQAALTTSPVPAWSSPSMAVVANAYAPWGNFADLAFADPSLPRIRRLLTSKAVPDRFKLMLKYWFDIRVGPSTLPAPSPLVHEQPLWSNQFLPIGITQAQHVHTLMLAAAPMEPLATRTQRLIQAVTAQRRGRDLGPHVIPTDKWLGWLATTVDAFKCGPVPSPTPKPPWLVRLHKVTKPLTQTTPAEARRRRAPPRTRLQLPTRHLGVEEDFYEAPAAYADFVYEVMLRAVKFRAHLHWLDRADQACLFCPAHETYRHFLVDCDFIKDVWSTLHAVT
ncbi:hypothetical protein SPRG_20150, partial [Saprolegnia parasitica CBS 223.65]